MFLLGTGTVPIIVKSIPWAGTGYWSCQQRGLYWLQEKQSWASSAFPLFRVLSVYGAGGCRTGSVSQLVQAQARIPAEHSSPGILILLISDETQHLSYFILCCHVQPGLQASAVYVSAQAEGC